MLGEHVCRGRLVTPSGLGVGPVPWGQNPAAPPGRTSILLSMWWTLCTCRCARHHRKYCSVKHLFIPCAERQLAIQGL